VKQNKIRIIKKKGNKTHLEHYDIYKEQEKTFQRNKELNRRADDLLDRYENDN
jgi:hypothetical protein